MYSHMFRKLMLEYKNMDSKICFEYKNMAASNLQNAIKEIS